MASLTSLPLGILLLALVLHQTLFLPIIATDVSSSSDTDTQATPSPVTHPDARPARALLAFDKTVSGPLVAGLNVSVTYFVHNVGQRFASDILLRDSSYPLSRFESTAPARTIWNSLAPGQSVTYSISVQPKRAGHLYVTPPTITYIDSEGDMKRTARLAHTRRGEGGRSNGRGSEYGDDDEYDGVGFGSSGRSEQEEHTEIDDGEAAVVVQDLVQYRRKNEKHGQAWLMYLGGCVLLSVAPFAVADSMTRKLNVKAVSGSKKSS